jgi:hypothetical protein
MSASAPLFACSIPASAWSHLAYIFPIHSFTAVSCPFVDILQISFSQSVEHQAAPSADKPWGDSIGASYIAHSA